jgi:hypothetical protein
MNVAWFESPVARFTTGGAGSVSANYLHLLFPGDGNPFGIYLQVDTGTSWGLGVSTTVGTFLLLRGAGYEDGVMPYKGE